LLELAGDVEGALERYETAARLATNIPERDYLLKQAARVRQERGRRPV
jgi:predicted RNA polymerase sigma factor